MRSRMSHVAVIAGIVLGAIAPRDVARAQSNSFTELSAEWWQWVLAIPTGENPLLDSTGENCDVGQSGSVWFLAGTFFGGTAVRDCTVPERTALFFPVVNSINFDTPNACGQGKRLPPSFYRDFSADFISGVTGLSVELDGQPIVDIHHVRSKVFKVTLPEDNVFSALCADLVGGVYSPAVDEGFYVKIDHLEAGSHTLRFQAENPSEMFSLDVTYHLNVVPE
jgi:hypothetical protein